MNGYTKFILLFLIIVFLSLMFSPFISLVLTDALRNHAYYRLAYNTIVGKETEGIKNDEDKILKIFQYVVEHEFPQGVPYKCKPFESLLYAEAYCDFQARTLNSLLAIVGVPSRYAMLFDKNNISVHTLNEVFLNKKWCVLDLAMNIILKDSRGNNVSLEQLSDNEGLIYSNTKLSTLKNYDIAQYENLLQLYSRVFPLPAQPIRSTPIIYKSHIFDFIIDSYFKIFKYQFSNFYQDIYLKLKAKKITDDDLKLFFMARNYHLFYRKDLTQTYYDALLTKYPLSRYREDAVFFSGVFNFELTKDFVKSIKLFKLITDKPDANWSKSAYYYLGKAYSFIDDKAASMSAYAKAGAYKLTPQIIEEMLEYREKNSNPRVSVSKGKGY